MLRLWLMFKTSGNMHSMLVADLISATQDRGTGAEFAVVRAIPFNEPSAGPPDWRSSASEN